MATFNTICQSQIKAYSETVEALDPIMADHKDAMACRDAEELVKVGLFLYGLLNDKDRRMRLNAVDGVSYGDAEWDGVDESFDLWLEVAQKVLGRVKDSIRRGYEVAQSAEFEAAIRQCESAKIDRDT